MEIYDTYMTLTPIRILFFVFIIFFLLLFFFLLFFLRVWKKNRLFSIYCKCYNILHRHIITIHLIWRDVFKLYHFQLHSFWYIQEFQRLDCPPPSVQYQNLERPVLPSLNQEERKRLFEATDDPANKRQRPDEEDGVEQVEQQQIAQNILPSPSIAQPSIAPTGETSAVWPSFVQLPVIEGLTGSRIQFPIIEGIGENIQLPTIEPMVENKIQTPNVEPVGENSEGENSEGIPSIVPILEVPSVSK